MKKIFALILAMVLCIGLLAACGNGDTKDTTPAASDSGNNDTKGTTPAASNSGNTDTKGLKLGFIFLHDENSTYDLNFMNAAKQAIADLGLTEDQYLFRTNIPEGQECYNAAAELADAGCNIIFADSFGHEDYIIQAAQEFPDVQFCHATGTKAHTPFAPKYRTEHIAQRLGALP